MKWRWSAPDGTFGDVLGLVGDKVLVYGGSRASGSEFDAWAGIVDSDGQLERETRLSAGQISYVSFAAQDLSGALRLGLRTQYGDLQNPSTLRELMHLVGVEPSGALTDATESDAWSRLRPLPGGHLLGGREVVIPRPDLYGAVGCQAPTAFDPYPNL